MSEGEDIKTTTVGTVEEVLPNSLFRVRILKEDEESSNVSDEDVVREAEVEEINDANGDLVLAYLAGKMRLHRIRVLMGDKVEMVLDPYGGRARIVRRLT
ncbi:MAG: hypothetical protein Q8L30_02700 [bacterium]|nr:hypothetical protein [bacterium]